MAEATAGRKLRMGIIGTGGMAQTAHLPALIKAHNIELLALAEAADDVRAPIAARYRVPRPYKTADELLADKDIEAVLIPVADAFHAPLSIAAMRAGKHVLVEKPLAPTIPECLEMVKVARETGRQMQIACMKRFDPALEIARKFVHEQMGKPTLISCWYCDSKFHMDYVRTFSMPWILSQGQKRPPEQPPQDPLLWVNLVHGVHSIDLLRFMGGDIAAVTCQGREKPEAVTSCVLLEFTSGCVGTLTLVCGVQMDWFEGLHIHGQHGSVIARIPFPYTRKASDVQIFDGRTNDYRTPAVPDADQYERQAEAFADALLHNRPVTPNGQDGLAAERIIYAIHESHVQGGKRVEVVRD